MKTQQLTTARSLTGSTGASPSSLSPLVNGSPAPSVPRTQRNPLTAAAERKLNAALRENSRDGVAWLSSNPNVNLAGTFQPSTSQYGQLVSRLISRRAAQAGISAGALVAASRRSQSMTAGSGSPFGVAAAGSPTIAAAMPASSGASILNERLVVLVSRVTGSFDVDEYILALTLGFTGYLAYHLDHTNIPDPEPDLFRDGDPTITMGDPTTGLYYKCQNSTAVELAVEPNVDISGWVQLLQSSTLYRTVLTTRKLHDRMTEFWTDHFNIDARLAFQGHVKPVDDREVIRANALGTFPALLTASATSPAMLFYLNQWSSQYTAPNENYARELMELHTLGEGNGYDEVDVADVAKLLCGRSVNFVGPPTQLGTYYYDSSLHDPSPTGFSILNNHPTKITISAGGQIQGDQLIAGLAAHPLTADYISLKMLRFLLQYEPTPAQVTAVAAVYTSTSGDIKEMIKAILTPANIDALLVPTPTVLKVKRPMQLMACFLRQVRGKPYWPVGVVADPMVEMRNRLATLGNAPFYWGPPNGYPDAEGAWIGSLLGRWDLLDSLTRNEFDYIDIDYTDLLALLGAYNASTIGVYMNLLLAGGTMAPDEEFWIQEYADIGTILWSLGEVTTEELVREIYAVAASAPTYQYY